MSSDTRQIALSRGMFATVDACDYDMLAAFKWCVQSDIATFYAKRNVPLPNGKQTSIRMHRVIMMPEAGLVVDHINHNGLDNRRANLRVCSVEENLRNRQCLGGTTSTYLGVSWFKHTGKWRASIRIGGKAQHLGLYADEIEAALAYDRAARQYHGEFANPNFPESELANTPD